VNEPWPYDLIAAFYDEDMGRNAGEAGLRWYRGEAGRAVGAAGGPLLELAAGTGRLTLPLAGDGHRVVALDRSPPMLNELVRKAAAAGLGGRVLPVATDMAAAGLSGRFAAVLCPFSAFGYLVEPDARAAMLSAVRGWLRPGGPLLLDMFIPDPGLAGGTGGAEITDYERPLPAGPWAPAVRLRRFKRIDPTGQPGVNRIRRRYQFLDAAGAMLREVRTESRQCVHEPGALLAVLRAAGFGEIDACGDFVAGKPPVWPARVLAVAARLGGGGAGGAASPG
jgi:SAM-dependent methyltransferase